MGRNFQYSVLFNYPIALLFVLQILAHHGPETIWADVILSQDILADLLVPHGVLGHFSIFERQSGCSNSMRGYLARGGTPLYKLYRYVLPHRVRFLRRFGLKTGIHIARFGLESGMVFRVTTGVYGRIYGFN